MTGRFETGPALVLVGALVLLVSLFVEWFVPLTAWEVFELLDLLLAGLALAAGAIAVGLLVPRVLASDRERLPLIVTIALVGIVVQLLDPPPAAGDAELGTGAWLAFAGALVMVAGAVLTFAKVSLAVSYQGREGRRRVAAVDARGAGPQGGDTPVTPEEPAPERT